MKHSVLVRFSSQKSEFDPRADHVRFVSPVRFPPSTSASPSHSHSNTTDLSITLAAILVEENVITECATQFYRNAHPAISRSPPLATRHASVAVQR
jgi:hypothetical protein